jgi:hypothetical protein
MTHYPLDARCNAMRRLPHYPLNARCIAMRRLPHHPLNACRIAMRRLPHYPLNTRCVSVRRLPVGRLPVHLLNTGFITLSRFSILPHSSRQRYPSLSLEHLRRSWWSVPLNRRHWQSGSDVRGFPRCILLGVAASHYNISAEIRRNHGRWCVTPCYFIDRCHWFG